VVLELGTRQIVAVDLDGNSDVVGEGDGDLSHISPRGWSEITLDGRGNGYVNTINFDFADFNAPDQRSSTRQDRALPAGRRCPRGGERTRLPERHGDHSGHARTEQVLVADAPAPGVGWP
jgi:hypothetical protein